MASWIYMLRCADGFYYMGRTDALERRLAEHSDGAVPGYTHDRRPVSLMYSCEFATREEALTMERRIEGWSRAKKEALFREDWRLLRDLSASRDS